MSSVCLNRLKNIHTFPNNLMLQMSFETSKDQNTLIENVYIYYDYNTDSRRKIRRMYIYINKINI